MSRLIGQSRFPDREPATEARKPRKSSPSDLRRRARRNAENLATARAERRDGWPDGKDEFSVDRQTRELSKLDADRRVLRREVYARAPELEGREFRKQHPGRSA